MNTVHQSPNRFVPFQASSEGRKQPVGPAEQGMRRQVIRELARMCANLFWYQ